MWELFYGASAHVHHLTYNVAAALNASHALVVTAWQLVHTVTYNRYCVWVHKNPSSIHCMSAYLSCPEYFIICIIQSSIMLWLLLFTQVLLLLVLLTFHKVFITSRSFLKAVTQEASLHLFSDSPFSEIELGKISNWWKVKLNLVISALVVLGEQLHNCHQFIRILIQMSYKYYQWWTAM